jgi:hypothetical protein
VNPIPNPDPNPNQAPQMSLKEAIRLFERHQRPIEAPIDRCVCVLLLQDLLQSCSRGGRRRVEDMCYERRRAEACVDESAHHALGPVRNPVL